MYTTPRKVKQESRLRRSLSLTNSNNNSSGNRIHNGNGIEINGDDSSAIPSLTSPYYTLSNRSSYHSHLNGIAEQPVSSSVPLSSSSQSLTDPYSVQREICIVDVQSVDPKAQFTYSTANGAIITIPDVIDVNQQPDGSSLHYLNNPHQQQYGGPPPYKSPPVQQQQSVITVGGIEAGNSSNGHQVGGPISPQSVPDSPVDAYHTHSAKFPIVKEVIISEREIQNGSAGTASSSSSSANGSLLRSTSAGTLPRTSSSSSSSTVTIPPPQSTSLLTPEYIKKFQNKKLTKHLAWKDERKALTLDSETAKELQNQLAAAAAQQRSSDSPAIRRSGSAFELEKLIEAFNQEQHALVMSSLHQDLVPKRRLDGIDNPALDLGPHNNVSSNPNGIINGHARTPSNSNSTYGTGGKMAGYSYSDSSTSQSLSLSSSNTDSLDTVIYKGPNAAGSQSVRDWQRSKEALQSDFGHHRSDTNAYRSDTQGMFDRSYPMQQASSSSYQPMQFNGPGNSGQTPSVIVSNGYAIEYRHQQQVQPHQNLSVQSVHQSQQQQHLHQQQQPNGIMRQTNGTSSAGSAALQQSSFNSASAGGITQSPMLPTKSPMVTHKPIHPPSSSSNQSVPSAGGGIQSSNLKGGLNDGSGNNGGETAPAAPTDKAKESTKMFPTKTYNHIKDMISSRFGNSSSSGSGSSTGLQQKGLNNSSMNNNNSGNSTSNTNGGPNNGPTTNSNSYGMNGNVQNGANSYMDSSMGIPPMPSYGMNQHGHIHSHSIHDSYGGANGQPSYYTGAPTMSPQNGGNVQHQQQQQMMNGNANSYRSPPMNDRKNVNTSFRKAINHSQNKSNLTEDSLQLRPIMENSLNGSNRDLYRGMQFGQQNGGEPSQQQRYGLGHEPPSPSLVPHHIERAQKALDTLVGGGVAPFTRTGSGPMTHQTGMGRMVQFSNGEQENASNNRPLYPINGSKIGAMSSASSSQLTTGGELGAPRNRFNVTPGPASSVSSTSNSSGGLGAGVVGASNNNSNVITVESSLSSPSSYTHSNKLIVHQAPTTSLASGNSTNNNNKSSSNTVSSNNHDQPPPLPSSQKPEVSGSGHSALSHHHYLGNNSNNNGSGNSHNTLGLPVLPSVLAGEKRENGDGSSNGETPSSGNLHTESGLSSQQQQQQGAIMSTTTAGGNSGCNASSSALPLNKSKSEQLKKITADLHNLAITVHSQYAPGSGPGGASASSFPSNNQNHHNSSSSECEKGSQRIGSGQSHTTSDSGVGTVMLTKSPLNSISDHESNGKIGGGNSDLLGGGDHKFGDHVMDSVSSGNDSEWVDIVEPEIRQILELEKKSKPGKSSRIPTASDKMPGASAGSLATSTPAHINQGHHQNKGNGASNGKNGSAGVEQGDLIGDISASPIPHHKLASGSPLQSPKVPKKFDLNAYNKKASQNRSQELLAGPSTSNEAQNGSASQNKVKSPRVPTKVNRSNSGAGQHRWNGRASRGDKASKAAATNRLIKDLGLKGIKLSRHAASQILYPNDDNGDVTSTTTGLDLESMLDGQTEQTSDDEDTQIDVTDAHAIRRQLESLESMYTEVLKVLGAKRFSGNRYPTSDLRNSKKRPYAYGSMSSLPSSVSSRPFRERKLKLDDKKKVKDIKSINKRFQRLESHVVTLARSVAHLSSEMRTQHLMVQEIESIRNEMQQLRNQVLKSSMQNQSSAAAATQNFSRVASGRNGAGVNFANAADWATFRNADQRVRKLTKFFGSEPPLVRMFLKNLGYEKYATAFENERIGINELPYLTEQRLNDIGIPMGPRLRILQEAQRLAPNHYTHHQNGPGNLSVYVV